MKDKKNTWKYDIFCNMYKCYKYDITLLPKKAKIIFSQRNTLKGDISGIIEKVDIHL